MSRCIRRFFLLSIHLLFAFYSFSIENFKCISIKEKGFKKISNAFNAPPPRYIYVSPTGNDANSGSVDAPMKSISYAIKLANPTDTVILKQGTYAERIVIGLNKRPLTIASEFLFNSDTSVINKTIIDASNFNNASAILDSSSILLDTSKYRGYLNLIGFKILGSRNLITENLTRVNYSNLIITIGSIFFGGITSEPFMFFNTSRSIFKNCLFSNIGTKSGPPNNYGILDLRDSTQVINCQFLNNLSDNGLISIRSYNLRDSIIISDNIFRNNMSQFSQNFSSSRIINIGYSYGVFIRNNIISNNYCHILNDNQNLDGKLFFSNNTVINNKVTTDNYPITIMPSSKGKMYFYNNIIQNNQSVNYKSQIGIPGTSASYGYPVLKLYHNIIGNDSASARVPNTNLLDSFVNVNSFTQLVNFKDTAKFDFQLSNSSSGIGYGTTKYNLPFYPKDFNGKVRPNPLGSNPDLGAIENPYAYSAPQLHSVEGADKKIKLFWNNVSLPGLVKYKIFRATTSIPDTASVNWLIDTVKINSLSYTDTSKLTNLTKYFYRLKVVDSSGLESALSNELSVKPNVQPPVVSNLQAESGPASILVKWKPSTNAGIRYTLYRSVDSIPLKASIIKTSISDSSYLDTTVTKLIPKYYYWIKAIDSVGVTSEFSSSINSKVIPIWYVAKNGSDSSIGSYSKPLKNIMKAITKLTNGDTVLVMEGVYQENLDFLGKKFILKSDKGADYTTIRDIDLYTGVYLSINSINADLLKEELQINGFKFDGSYKGPRIVTIWVSNSTPIFKNCVFKNFDRLFGEIHSAQFLNCIFENNNTIIGNNSNPSLTNFINSTITRNRNIVTNNNPLFFMNCIITFTGNYANYLDTTKKSSLPSGLVIANSIVDDTLYSKINSNSSIRPSFGSDDGNYRLKISSNGLGMGLKSYVYNNRVYNAPTTDFDGNPRPNPVGSRPDVGAFENAQSSPIPFIGLVQKTTDTTLINWEYFDKTKVLKIILYRDTTINLDTTKAVKKILSFNPQDLYFRDTLPAGSTLKYYYAIKLLLKDSSISNLSNIQAANGVVKTTSFIPPMVNARYAWGDIDADGDMDLAVMGNANEIFLQIYKNNNGSFSEILNRNTAAQVYKGTIKFADIDNDGDIDLFVSGQKTTSTTNIGAFLFKNDGSGVFAQTELTSVIATREGDAAFGDHDNDGDLDLALSGIDASGKSILKLYDNSGIGTFTQETRFFSSTSGPTNISYADLAWIDYDNDGDQDLIYTGVTSMIYGGIVRNTLITDSTTTVNGNTVMFNDFSIKDANFELADLNGDGKVDMVISGTGGTKIIYNQNIKTISMNLGTISTLIDSVAGKVKLADYDNDGDIDILFAGTDNLANPRTIFYINSGDGRAFTKKTYEIIPNLDMAGFSWADYDNDKDLDLVISGQKPSSQGGNVISEIYSFEPEKRNLPPNKPQNLALQDFGDGRILVKWNPATDDLNPTGTLNYLVKIGSISLGGNIGKPFTVVESNKKGGNLLNPEAVLVYSNKYFTQLDPGKYYVLVQSVDNNKLTSVFSDTLYLTLTYPWKIVNQGGIVDGTISGNTNYSAKWGDIDRDNDYDFVYGNALFESNRINYKPAIYQNGAATLLNSMINPNIKWNDLNQDGVPDMIISSSETISPTNSTQEKFRLNIYLNDTSVTATDPITKQITGKGRLTKANISPEDTIFLGNSRFKVSDINNDGKPDIMFAGLNKSSESRIHIFSTGPLPTDTSNSIKFRFNRLKTNLDSILLSQQSTDLLFDFGDVDADNDNDFVAIYKNAIGKNLAKVFLNAGLDSVSGKIIFNESSRYSFEALDFATLDLIDYDKDGDLDLITSGRSFANGKQFIVYESKDSSFTKVQSNVAPFENGKLTFGDLNNDGFADLIYSGTREGAGYISKVAVFDPVKKIFNEQIQFSFGDYQNLTIEFGDFDADNDLDILLYGREKTSNKDLFKVYKNVQNESASVLKAIKFGGKANLFRSNEVIISSRMNNLTMSSIGTSSNNSTATMADEFNENMPPSVPANLKENLLRKVVNKYKVRFNWNASTDDKTPISGLTYELRVGTTPGASDVVVSSSKENGFKLIPEEGNVGRNKAWEIDLPAGKYYWSVQAVDASLSGSAFASERQFIINSTGGICSVEIPIASIIANKSSICLGDTTTLKSSVSAGIQWFKDDVAISNATDTLLRVTLPGSYKVAKTASGCSSAPSNVLTISQKTTPSSGSLSLIGSVPCEGGTVVLTASSDSVVAWYRDTVLLKGVVGKTFTATSSGLYSIVSNSTNGCLSSKSTALPVNFKPFPKSTVTLSNKSICEGTKTKLSVNSATNYIYQWSKNGIDILGATDSIYLAGDSGTYKVRVTLDGCSSISAGDTLKVYSIPAKPSITKDTTQLVSSATAGNQWYLDGKIIPGATEQRFKPAVQGSYTVLINLNNCESQISESYYFLSTAIVNLPNGQYIKAYPNPVQLSGNLTIDWNIGGINDRMKIQVFNTIGNLVLSKVISKNDNKIQIPGASGLYTIKLIYNKIQTSIIRIYKN